MSRVGLRTPLTPVAGLLGLVVVLVFGMYAYDHARGDQIAKGVKVDGIDVGGLSSAAARARVQRQVAGAMERPITASLDGRDWQIVPRQAGLTVDLAATVDEALKASRSGSIFTRTWRGITGESVDKDVALRVRYSHQSVREFAAQVRTAVDRPPRDASVQPTAGGLTEVKDSPGLTVDAHTLSGRVEHALTSATASRNLAVPVHTIKAQVTTRELAAKYPAYIVVDRAKFELRFYSHLKLANTYPIAVGMEGLETPAGLYHIQWEQTNPPWYVPKDSWAGALAGKVIPPGPEDPLKARFMAFDGGAGIHGIDPSEYGTIGHDASHGCVRMRIPDVIAVYARSPVGTPVYVL